MSDKADRRSFFRYSAAAAAGTVGLAGCSYWIGGMNRVSKSVGKKVIVLGIDGMDPRLCATMMQEGLLPNLHKLSSAGGFSILGTSIPPQGPVAWANFINGAGPGSHGIFDVIHRRPNEPYTPFHGGVETLPGQGSWDVDDYRLQLDDGPFQHVLPTTVLRRQGIPFWDYLDAAGIASTFYDLPANYPPAASQHGNHRCLCGMGTPDVLGTYGTYQYFSEDVPAAGLEERGGRRSKLVFHGDTAEAGLMGPHNGLAQDARRVTARLVIRRDSQTDNALLVVQDNHHVTLKAGQWSQWIPLVLDRATPSLVPDKPISGICRFYLQEVSPTFRLYVTPINIDPSAPALPLSEPPGFVQDVAKQLGLFYTAGLKEDHKARSNGVFVDDEFLKQATMVLEQRLALFEYAVEHYDDGLLYFHFSSADLQSHMFWWNSDQKHPTRSRPQVAKYFAHIRRLYRQLDSVVGDVFDRYGGKSTIFVLSGHGFTHFGRQFNLNSWLRDEGYLGPRECRSLSQHADWSRTRAYGLGINGLYLNLKGREPDGIVEPGEEQELLIRELVARLQAVRDFDGKRVIGRVYRADEVYAGSAATLAPDLIVGYAAGYRASWATCQGNLTRDVLLDNDSAWSADHCADAPEVPGVLFCSEMFRGRNPALIDIGPSILATFGLPKPRQMTGKNLFAS